MKHLEYLSAAYDLFSEVRSGQGDHSAEDSVDDERAVVHELVGGERGHRFEEERRGRGEVAHHERVQALVDFETVTSIPVTALFDQARENVCQLI